MSKRCLIIGGSHASAQLGVSLRQGGWEGAITILSDEAHLPYHHPPLSKDFLSGEKSIDDILIRPAEAYETANIDLKLSTRAKTIDRESKSVLTDKGERLEYDTLVLTTGARVRRLPIPGEDLDSVYYLRDARDVQAIKDAVVGGKSAVIIGGGYIGLETAASLTKLGVKVTLLEAMPRILQRVTAPELSSFYKRVHTEEGVVIQEGVIATEIKEVEGGLSVLTKGGDAFMADFCIIGIGVIPNTELAVEAGLDVGNGIVVNEFCQTSDPEIFAAGDVTWHYNPIYDRHIRLESVPNATEQAKTIAAFLCAKPKPYNSLPWFWSDQFDLKLQIAGLSTDYSDIVIRGDIETGRSFAAFYFDGDRLLAVDGVNAPREFAMTRMILTKGQNLDKTKVGNMDISLKDALIKD